MLYHYLDTVAQGGLFSNLVVLNFNGRNEWNVSPCNVFQAHDFSGTASRGVEGERGFSISTLGPTSLELNLGLQLLRTEYYPGGFPHLGEALIEAKL